MAQAASNLVETRALTKQYGAAVLAVQNLNLTIHEGDVYGLLGPNGAGKTTALRMLTGLIRPTSGTAIVAGGPPGSHQSLARVGAMIETPAFWPYLSGRDNLRLLARYCRLPDSRVPPVLTEVGMTEHASRAFGTYSTGMKQRLGVAAALLKDPALLILDEPTNGLDPQGMVEFRNLIRDLGRGSRTVLLSSHLLNEVEQICTRIGVIRQGTLVAEGTIDEIRGGSHLVVRATPFDEAKRILEQAVGADKITVQDGTFSLSVDTSQAAAIARDLVTGGVELTELRPGERSLEDVFIELTGTESGS
ncbi:MAG TPA: ABC transporter ATP-binding protein [Candidatus Dormibacteraeota bacterium]|nr:ABC transporter ATP-binding protein [Candidatus Dormibacteraeota bacterium]